MDIIFALLIALSLLTQIILVSFGLLYLLKIKFAINITNRCRRWYDKSKTSIKISVRIVAITLAIEMLFMIITYIPIIFCVLNFMAQILPWNH